MNNFIKLFCMKVSDLDILIGKNLKRIRESKKLSQENLGEMINITNTKISAIENGREGMGKDIMTRICNTLNIRPDEFYINKETPVLQDKDEQKMINIYREAKELGSMIAEKIPEYGKFIIKETKKPHTSSSQKSKTLRHKEG